MRNATSLSWSDRLPRSVGVVRALRFLVFTQYTELASGCRSASERPAFWAGSFCLSCRQQTAERAEARGHDDGFDFVIDLHHGTLFIFSASPAIKPSAPQLGFANTTRDPSRVSYSCFESTMH